MSHAERPTALSALDRAVLGVEARWWRYRGARAEALLALGVTETRAAQILNRLLDDPAALAAEPMTIHRLQRLRTARLEARRRP